MIFSNMPTECNILGAVGENHINKEKKNQLKRLRPFSFRIESK